MRMSTLVTLFLKFFTREHRFLRGTSRVEKIETETCFQKPVPKTKRVVVQG